MHSKLFTTCYVQRLGLPNYHPIDKSLSFFCKWSQEHCNRSRWKPLGKRGGKLQR